MRIDGREFHALRPISFETGFLEHHPSSVMVKFGKTRVLCTAISENRVPQHRLESKGGWLSAEYSMLPGSTIDRKARAIGKAADGRSVEIQRLIGRALRQAVDMDRIGVRTIHIDCDVICADGGTRTAAITGSWVALALWLKQNRLSHALLRQVAAVSLGIVDHQVLTDLNYLEDVAASTDFNLIACDDGTLVEFQGAAEIQPMQREQINQILDQGLVAIKQICALQNTAISLG